MRNSLMCTFVAALLMCPVLSMATEIKNKEYAYQYGDTVKSMSQDAFVVCDGCKSDKLIKESVDFFAIKYNDPPAVRDEALAIPSPVVQTQEAPKPANKEISHIGTVYFRFGSERLNAVEKKKLDKIVAAIPSGDDVAINGYTCIIGKNKYNQKLSERRARAVASYLKAKGARISKVKGKGKCCQVSETNKSLNRRVELTKKEIN